MKQILVTAGVIADQNGNILLAQRLASDHEGGKWEFPGGKIEAGEDPRAGLERELQEEMGIQTKAGQVLEVISEVKNDLHLVLIYFACQIIAGEPAALDCQQVRWLKPEEIGELEMPGADWEFWRKYHEQAG